ncbi:hypothetical protein COO60DRAFT_382017 [Scenedesmus sp. NREL 46B-D3]|nr:hypothetical protein COO60DRAFT_382017 [Scenedesmus sp. NREL 46B-D3]
MHLATNMRFVASARAGCLIVFTLFSVKVISIMLKLTCAAGRRWMLLPPLRLEYSSPSFASVCSTYVACVTFARCVSRCFCSGLLTTRHTFNCGAHTHHIFTCLLHLACLAACHNISTQPVCVLQVECGAWCCLTRPGACVTQEQV